MTPQEQGLLDGLIGRIQSAHLTTKDTEADRRIQDALGKDPDALYILCQTVLLQVYALEQAQKQLALKEQVAQAQQPQQHEPTFLEKIFGRSEPEPPQPQPGTAYPTQTSNQPGYGAPVYNQTPAPGQAQYGQQGYLRPGYGQPSIAYPPGAYPVQPGYGTAYAPYGGGAPMSSGGGGFLQGALQTAAGVALGEMAFQTVEDLFRGFGHSAGYGSDRAVGFSDVNSGSGGDYGQGGGFFSREQAENGANDQLSPDIEDRRGESSSGFADVGSGGSPDAFANADDSTTDSGYDVDNSGTEADGSDFFDNGGGGFDSGDNGFDDGGSFSDNS
ncbi:DUF2076 domain-containing protein [Terriglobus sp.]|uniref:DUF2076 domain-containing protein n=1 Tax=Terriglobus sp. TaxID=1889013 RepID=UPI003AFF730A